MGVSIPQIITGDSAAGAAQLTHSVKFNARGQYSQQQNHQNDTSSWNTNDGCDLAFTPASNGNRRTWTYSTWIKRSKILDSQQSRQDTFMGIFGHTASSASSYHVLLFNNNTDQLSVWISGTGGGGAITALSNAEYRDTNGWYNIVWVSDTTVSDGALTTMNSRWNFYINGVNVADVSQGGGYATDNRGSISQNHDGFINSSSYETTIGSQRSYNTDSGRFFDGYMSQCVMVDGQALDASYFGFEDPMTGVWRPKKFNIEDCPTADFGTNGFYLPMDGSGPIGKDQSGKGNDWTPRGFEGTAPLNNAEGGLPIQETSDGINSVYKGYAATRWSENAVFNGDSRGMPLDTRGYIGYAVTVANPTGSQNRFYIGMGTDNDASLGGEEAPLLRLARGQTVNFFQSDSTNTNHPLKIGTTAEASSAASGYNMVGFAHTVGTPGTSRQARFTITIPNDAPDTLYYSCANHTGMGGTISVYTDPVVADPFAAKCRVAMPISANRQDRACGVAVTAEFKDVSDSGSDVGIRTSSGGLYGISGHYFKGVSGYLDRASSSDYNLGQAPFTMEIWCWPSNCKTGGQYKRAWEFGSSYSDSICLSAETVNNGITWRFRYDNTVICDSATQTGTGSTCHVINKKWTHVAVVREGTGSNETKLYVDGILASTGTVSDALDFSSNTLRIGANNSDSSNSSWNGYLNDFRFYKDVAKYTKNFSVPSISAGTFVKDTPFALPAGGPARSPKYGHGSVFVGQSKDNYNGVVIPGFGLTASQDYTIEFYYWWVGAQAGVIWQQDDGTNRKNWVTIHKTGYPQSYWNGSTGLNSDGKAGVLQPNSWNHICFEYNSANTTTAMFVNGGLLNWTNTGSTWEGPGSGDGLSFGNIGVEQSTTTVNGAISNFRVVKGRRVYQGGTGQAGFQPPSGPLENVSGTYLLCAKDPTDPLAYEVAPAATLATIGATPVNARSDTPPGSFSGSCEFDGTGDSLLPTVSNKFKFGRGDFTIECWVKSDSNSDTPYIVDFRDDGSNTGTTNKPVFYVNTSNKLIYWVNGSSRIESDTSISTGSWYHVALVRCGNTHTMYINGVAQGQQWMADINYTATNMTVTIGQRQGYSAQSWDGFISNFRINRTAVYKEGFTPGSEDLHSIPGTVLLCCKSSSSATAQDTPWPLYKQGHVYSSENNPFDSQYDLRAGRESNYATLNSLPACTDNNVFISNGGLTYYSPSDAGKNSISLSSLHMPTKSGKWYCEYQFTWGDYPEPGLALVKEMEENDTYDSYFGERSYQWMWYGGTVYNGGNQEAYGKSSTPNAIGAPSATGAGILGIGFDSDIGQLNFYWNGADQGAMRVGLRTDSGGHYAFGCGANSQNATWNFGQQPFASPVPFGYKALCSSNFYDVGITTMRNSDINPQNHIGIVTYRGDGATSRNIRTLGWQPDLMWIAPRSEDNWKVLFDSVRGDGKSVYSNSNWSQESLSNTGGAPLIDGFTIGYNSSYSNVFTNKDTVDYVAWCWRAGGNKGTWNVDGVGYDTAAKAGLDGGSIDPTGASVNTKAGFGIYKYEGNGGSGATIAHGLPNEPAFIMIKRLDGYSGSDNAGDWMVGCDSVIENSVADWTYYMVLNKDQGKANDFSPFSAPTGSVFTINNSNRVNNNGDDYVAYAWCNMPGLCKVGQYQGTGSATDSPVIYTGFKPALIMIKRVDSANDWNMQDIVRSPFNEMDNEVLQANSNSSESNIGTGYARDHLSNGFKLRQGNTETNGSNAEYLYIAWSSAALSNQYGGVPNAQ
tara:strand:- start:4225 stop:9516 length:5292 start_codon:yes stop_codon:yes gene_type:complete